MSEQAIAGRHTVLIYPAVGGRGRVINGRGWVCCGGAQRQGPLVPGVRGSRRSAGIAAACAAGATATLDLLLARGVHLEAPTARGDTALLLAAPRLRNKDRLGAADVAAARSFSGTAWKLTGAWRANRSGSCPEDQF